MENPIKMDDLGLPLFLETPKISVVVFSGDGSVFFTGDLWFHQLHIKSFGKLFVGNFMKLETIYIRTQQPLQATLSWTRHPCIITVRYTPKFAVDTRNDGPWKMYPDPFTYGYLG